MVSPVLKERQKRHFFPHFGFAFKPRSTNVKVMFVDLTNDVKVEVHNQDYTSWNSWEYYFKDLGEVDFLTTAWSDDTTELEWQIVLLFDVGGSGSISIDNIGPCALDEIFFPGSSVTANRVSSCFWMGVSYYTKYIVT